MIAFSKVISTAFDLVNRLVVKVRRNGKDDVQTALQIAPYGVDSNPIKDMYAIYAPTGRKGKEVIVGYLNINKLAQSGESRLYATDDEGELQTYIWLKKDGTILMAGDADNLVRFANTKLVVDEIQSDLAALKQAFSTWVVAPGDGGAALKATAATWFGAPLTETIDPSKIDEIKTL